MSPRDTKPEIKSYRPILSEPTRDSLHELSYVLGFVVTSRNYYTGRPSVPDMLDALAAAYRRNPEGVALALKVLGVVPPDATE